MKRCYSFEKSKIRDNTLNGMIILKHSSIWLQIHCIIPLFLELTGESEEISIFICKASSPPLETKLWLYLQHYILKFL